MAGYISDIDVSRPNGDLDYIDQLDTYITEFKQQVKVSFPNVNVEVSVTPAQLNQLVDNDFDSTITEGGVEIAKLSGGTFTGPVYDTGAVPVDDNQLVNLAYVTAAIQAAVDAVTP